MAYFVSSSDSEDEFGPCTLPCTGPCCRDKMSKRPLLEDYDRPNIVIIPTTPLSKDAPPSKKPKLALDPASVQPGNAPIIETPSSIKPELAKEIDKTSPIVLKLLPKLPTIESESTLHTTPPPEPNIGYDVLPKHTNDNPNPDNIGATNQTSIPTTDKNEPLKVQTAMLADKLAEVEPLLYSTQPTTQLNPISTNNPTITEPISNTGSEMVPNMPHAVQIQTPIFRPYQPNPVYNIAPSLLNYNYYPSTPTRDEPVYDYIAPLHPPVQYNYTTYQSTCCNVPISSVCGVCPNQVCSHYGVPTMIDKPFVSIHGAREVDPEWTRSKRRDNKEFNIEEKWAEFLNRSSKRPEKINLLSRRRSEGRALYESSVRDSDKLSREATNKDVVVKSREHTPLKHDPIQHDDFDLKADKDGNYNKSSDKNLLLERDKAKNYNKLTDKIISLDRDKNRNYNKPSDKNVPLERDKDINYTKTTNKRIRLECDNDRNYTKPSDKNFSLERDRDRNYNKPSDKNSPLERDRDRNYNKPSDKNSPLERDKDRNYNKPSDKNVRLFENKQTEMEVEHRIRESNLIKEFSNKILNVLELKNKISARRSTLTKRKDLSDSSEDEHSFRKSKRQKAKSKKRRSSSSSSEEETRSKKYTQIKKYSRRDIDQKTKYSKQYKDDKSNRRKISNKKDSSKHKVKSKVEKLEEKSPSPSCSYQTENNNNFKSVIIPSKHELINNDKLEMKLTHKLQCDNEESDLKTVTRQSLSQYFSKIRDKDNLFENISRKKDNLTICVPNLVNQNTPLDDENKNKKGKNKKRKKFKLVINVVCGSSDSSDSGEENDKQVVERDEDLSFLNDLNIDEIVESLVNKNVEHHNQVKAGDDHRDGRTKEKKIMNKNKEPDNPKNVSDDQHDSCSTVESLVNKHEELDNCTNVGDNQHDSRTKIENLENKNEEHKNLRNVTDDQQNNNCSTVESFEIKNEQHDNITNAAHDRHNSLTKIADDQDDNFTNVVNDQDDSPTNVPDYQDYNLTNVANDQHDNITNIADDQHEDEDSDASTVHLEYLSDFNDEWNDKNNDFTVEMEKRLEDEEVSSMFIKKEESALEKHENPNDRTANVNNITSYSPTLQEETIKHECIEEPQSEGNIHYHTLPAVESKTKDDISFDKTETDETSLLWTDIKQEPCDDPELGKSKIESSVTISPSTNVLLDQYLIVTKAKETGAEHEIEPALKPVLKIRSIESINAESETQIVQLPDESNVECESDKIKTKAVDPIDINVIADSNDVSFESAISEAEPSESADENSLVQESMTLSEAAANKCNTILESVTSITNSEDLIDMRQVLGNTINIQNNITDITDNSNVVMSSEACKNTCHYSIETTEIISEPMAEAHQPSDDTDEIKITNFQNADSEEAPTHINASESPLSKNSLNNSDDITKPKEIQIDTEHSLQNTDSSLTPSDNIIDLTTKEVNDRASTVTIANNATDTQNVLVVEQESTKLNTDVSCTTSVKRIMDILLKSKDSGNNIDDVVMLDDTTDDTEDYFQNDIIDISTEDITISDNDEDLKIENYTLPASSVEVDSNKVQGEAITEITRNIRQCLLENESVTVTDVPPENLEKNGNVKVQNDVQQNPNESLTIKEATNVDDKTSNKEAAHKNATETDTQGEKSRSHSLIRLTNSSSQDKKEDEVKPPAEGKWNYKKGDKYCIEQLESRMLSYLKQPYTVTRIIRRGKFSNIYQCHNSKGKKFAVKILSMTCDRLYMGARKEEMMMTMQKDIPKQNLNFVYIINGFSLGTRWCFLMEYFPKNLEIALRENQRPFHINVVQILSQQLVAAVTVLRNNNVVHTDIKPTHILMNNTNDKLKLCGFDEAQYMNCLSVRPNYGTASYRAPEVILGYYAGYSMDVWATALVMYEMATGRQLLPGKYNNDILYKQICTLGHIPEHMINDSLWGNKHFTPNYCFKRQHGPLPVNVSYINQQNIYRNTIMQVTIMNTYNALWSDGVSRKLRSYELSKVKHFTHLLEQMLVIDPRSRLPIEFVFTHNFLFKITKLI